MKIRRHKHWGWGYEDQQPSPEALRETASLAAEHLGLALGEIEAPVGLEQVALRSPRVRPPAALAEMCASDDHARASHALGKSYSDVVNGFRGRFEHPPDFVARPREEADVERLLEWCCDEHVAAIAFGGGTSVVGGVTADVPDSYNGAIAIDLRALDRVLEVDEVSRSARIQGGATGPLLEAQLGEHGLTLRHFPQSFEYSTLGGWIATRAAGHFATVWTHIEDFVESARAITPVGVWQSRRLPGSGAGVSPDRMLAGSEGTLGLITEAWVRVQPRPQHRRSAGVLFSRFSAGAECVRALSQSGLSPANCRLIDAREAAMTMAADGTRALLVLGFESTDHAVDEAMSRALAICSQHGGDVPDAASGRGSRGGGSAGRGSGGGSGRASSGRASAGAGGEDAVGSWRDAFLGAPYARDVLVAMGVLAETFETAITWERLAGFHERVKAAGEQALRDVCGEGSRMTARFTHVYANGPAVYFTAIAPARRGEEVEQWAQIKAAVSDAILAEGGTITHHHAVGRDHRPWYDRQRPDAFAAAFAGAKAAVDPHGVMNPGVLIDAHAPAAFAR
ncbi:MAG TPA: FAD-binding oxidoreductase [Solirubrobacteraceae bacterium]|nr:FAD-binding oxidoreductase [Solirubrobacteraceae bacterium]